MNRANFIKGLMAIVAAPALLDVLKPVDGTMPLKYAPLEKIVPEVAEEKTHVFKYSLKRGYHFKVTPEMMEDVPLMTFLISNPRSPINKEIVKAGVDLDKPFSCQVGFAADDFVQNVLTVVVEQYKDAA